MYNKIIKRLFVIFFFLAKYVLERQKVVLKSKIITTVTTYASKTTLTC